MKSLNLVVPLKNEERPQSPAGGAEPSAFRQQRGGLFPGMEGFLQPVLESALVTGAISARIVLVPTTMTDINGGSSNTLSYGFGVSCDSFNYLDDQVLALMRQREKMMVTNFSRPRLFSISPGRPHPEAILAFLFEMTNSIMVLFG
jgi:hypothetical protein